MEIYSVSGVLSRTSAGFRMRGLWCDWDGGQETEGLPSKHGDRRVLVALMREARQPNRNPGEEFADRRMTVRASLFGGI